MREQRDESDGSVTGQVQHLCWIPAHTNGKTTTHHCVAGHQSGCTRSQISFVGPHRGWRTFLRQLIREPPLCHDLPTTSMRCHARGPAPNKITYIYAHFTSLIVSSSP